ncbi:MAG: malate dehydrogenase [Candidatus Omnitrophota bacterium]|nr:malate dehydrogenase [Candidatus Omnitrophota bacterium]
MKISIIGAGNVGGLTAMRLAEAGFGDIVLADITKGLALGKAFDLEDAGSVLKYNYCIRGTDDIEDTKNSDIIIITAGLTRKLGMSREDLLNRNAEILKGVCLKIKKISSQAILIVVTNPLDLMTYLVLKITGFKSNRVFGMGPNLDTARFANLISKELNIPNTDIEACVIGSHGEGMLPLARFTTVKGMALNELLDDEKIKVITKKTLERGLEIVSLLRSGSAYLAPSQAIATVVRIILKDEKRIIGVSAYLNGEYGINDTCIGVPCRIGKDGIEKIIELELNKEERLLFFKSAESIRKNLGLIKPFCDGLL